MKILFNDVMQTSTAPTELKTPSLSDIYYLTNEDEPLSIFFPKPVNIDCIGLGNCSTDKIDITLECTCWFDGGEPDTTQYEMIIDGGTAKIDNLADTYDGNFAEMDTIKISVNYTGDGLYLLDHGYRGTFGSMTISAQGGASIGRIAVGKMINIPTALAKEPGFNSTAEPRKTLSGQIISGAGGYNYRTLSLDSRYRITQEAMEEIKSGYKYIGMGYPFFILLDSEAYKLPFDRFYATEAKQDQLRFEGGIPKYLYSRRWEFSEAF